ncbi:MAG: heavy metal translocating P-type ATPase [Clostridia bacterium]|nr:heavy metal translocating P-type ATPase [Clostridia bacterium]
MEKHEHKDGCGCGHEHEDGCGCCHEHEDGCGCGHEHKDGCGCCHEHEDGCGCGHEHKHEEHCSCGCSCGHDHGNDEAAKAEIPRLLLALALFAAGLLLPSLAGKALLLACYLVSGYDVLRSAFRSLGRGRMLDENFLMAVASLAAIAIGELTEGCAVMLFYQVGECCQAYAVGRSRRQVRALLALKADEAFVLRGGEFAACNPAEVKVGDTIRIRPGERVPLDAVVISGTSQMDTSALTGESVERTAQPGDSVLAGFVLRDGVITARVEKPLAESSVSRILAMVEEAQERKAPAERFITVFARVYTPVVVGLALVLGLVPPLFLGAWRTWIYRALTFLVASCPCALVISVPLCYFAGIGSAARRGILIKGGDSLDALCRVRQFVLDKTGTLTTGTFSVVHVHPQAGYTQEDVLALIAGAEKDSSHPLALAAVEAARARGVAPEETALERENAGRGVVCRTPQGETVLAGSLPLMQENGVEGFDAGCALEGARIYVSRAGRPVGMICLQDTIKPGAREAIAQLRRRGVERVVMLTGDREAPALAAAAELGVDEAHAQLLPQDKLELLEEILAQGPAAFVGDGINDAPALVRADVGVAMGALGSDAAIEAADLVLMTDEPDRLPQALDVALRVRRLARQNVVIALGVKIGVLALAAFGMAGMWAAVFADVGVALICVLNAMRAMR